MEENTSISAIHDFPTVSIIIGPLKREASEPTNMHKWAWNFFRVVEEAHVEGCIVACTMPTLKTWIIHDMTPSLANGGGTSKALGTRRKVLEDLRVYIVRYGVVHGCGAIGLIISKVKIVLHGKLLEFTF
jgi:hypothetical protein